MLFVVNFQEDMKNGKKIDGDKTLYSTLDNHVFLDDDLKEVNTLLP